jgi:hypothetical protein
MTRAMLAIIRPVEGPLPFFFFNAVASGEGVLAAAPVTAGGSAVDSGNGVGETLGLGDGGVGEGEGLGVGEGFGEGERVGLGEGEGEGEGLGSLSLIVTVVDPFTGNSLVPLNDTVKSSSPS